MIGNENFPSVKSSQNPLFAAYYLHSIPNPQQWGQKASSESFPQIIHTFLVVVFYLTRLKVQVVVSDLEMNTDQLHHWHVISIVIANVNCQRRQTITTAQSVGRQMMIFIKRTHYCRWLLA